MATVPSDPRPVTGRVDRAGRLTAADAPLEALQREAGGALGKTLAVPQLAAIAKLAGRLGTPVSRPVIAANQHHDLELLVRAIPDADGVEIVIERWEERPAAAPRLATILGARGADPVESAATWSVNELLEIVSVSQQLSDHLGMPPEQLIGQPLTKVLRLEDDGQGEMPLLTALATRSAFKAQRARARHADAPILLLSGEIAVGPAGEFAGLAGSAEIDGPKESLPPVLTFDAILDQALRSPLDRIIEQAERIVDQRDGPIQPDYAAYGNDIATAARHLLSVVGSMSEQVSEPEGLVNLAGLAEEAVVMLEAAAEDKGIAVQLQARRRLPVRADRRAVIQILVNLIGNAIRHSPEKGHVDLYFTRRDGMACVSVEDQGPGIPPGDEQRIFERFERATDEGTGTGLGLAIARRLARSMGGDVLLDEKSGPGARFSLCLPEA